MTKTASEEPRFFPTQADLRAWFQEHHATCEEQWVGYYKKASGTQSITWPESVDEALCFGWIDGLRKSIDEKRYKIRFTPRRAGSHWSAKNLTRMLELLKAGLVQPAGVQIYEARNLKRVKLAAYEQGDVELPSKCMDSIRANESAWTYFEAAPPSYRKQVSWWVVSAKQEATRERRLNTLIESCASGQVVPPLRWMKKK